jgi:hypothetical protein
VTGEQFSPNFRSTTVAYAYTNVDLSYGVYLSPEWQLGFRQALNYNFIDDGSDVWMATTAPFVNYQLRITDIIVPYLGAFIGAAWNDRDVTGALGPQAGINSSFMSRLESRLPLRVVLG